MHKRLLILLLVLLAVILVVPPFWASRASTLMLTQVLILATFAMSYNVLLGQTGLLSFGHAVYFGIGAFAALFTVNAITRGSLILPLELVPVVAAVAGLGAAALFGLISIRSGRIAFAMITLGLAELITVFAMIFPSIFGGERGVSIDRMVDLTLTGWDFARPHEVYWLVLFWSGLAIGTMAWLTRTPLGRLANAVRDNEQRVSFLGYDPNWIRYMQFCIAGTFAGMAGGMFALTYEIANFDVFGLQTSASVLIATFVGGTASVFGPVLGAFLVSLLEANLSRVTEAWLFYYGLLFIVIVMFAPKGLWSIAAGIPEAFRRQGFAGWVRGVGTWVAMLAPGMAGGVAIIEMASHLANAYDPTASVHMPGFSLDAFAVVNWAIALVLIAVTSVLLVIRHRRNARRMPDELMLEPAE